MKTDEFLATVRDRGNYADQAEAREVTGTVLTALAHRLGVDDAKEVAAQLPVDLQDAMTSVTGPAEPFGVDAFLARVAHALSTSTETAKWDASAVLTTLAEAMAEDGLNQLLGRVQSGYAVLFGKPVLA
jgi:uncharacterized protein (DUF2267 family)